MSVHSRKFVATFLVYAGLTLACAQEKADPIARDTAGTSADSVPPSTAQVQAAAGNPVSAPLTLDDIGRWENGMAGEMKAVKDAAAKMKAAKTSTDTLDAMMGVQEMSTVAAGAEAAGLEEERYKFVRSNLSSVAAYLTPALGGIDTAMLTQAQRDELRQGNEAQIQRLSEVVPSEVVAALKPRAAELRKKDLELVAARLKAAGMQ